MTSSRIRLPVGVRDFLPRAAARRRAIAEALLAEFERWGYDRIITPAFEYLDVLARGLGNGARAAALRFVEPATGEVLALRPDITPQVARIAATRLGEVPSPIRLSYEGSVLRLAPGARGQRELIQAGVELIDATAPAGDAEVLALAGAALRAADIADVTLDVGHVALAQAAFAAVDDPELRASLSALIAHKDAEGVARAAPPRARRLLAALPGLYGEPGDVLARARALRLARPLRAALDELERTLELVAELGEPGRVTLDLGEVQGVGYYTGVRFAGYVAGVGDAVLRGGRYDHLVERYGRAARATGFAIDVEAIAQAEHARGLDLAPAPHGLLVVCRGDAACRERARRIAAAVRRLGVRAAEGNDDRAFAVTLTCRGRVARAGDGRRIPVGLIDAAAAGRAEPLARALGIVRKGETHGRRRHRRRPMG